MEEDFSEPRELIPPPRIWEGSYALTYITLNHALRRQVETLLQIGVSLTFDGNPGRDVLLVLRAGHYPDMGFPLEYTQVEQYLIARKLKELSGKPEAELYRKSFIVAETEPAALLKATSVAEFVGTLSHDYPGWRAVETDFHPSARERLFPADKPRNDCEALSFRYPRYVSGPDVEESDLATLHTMVRTFEKLKAPIYFGILRYLVPLAPDLCRCSEARREEIMGNIVAVKPPFDRFNQKNWLSLILKAAAQG